MENRNDQEEVILNMRIELDKIIHDDCINGMKNLPENSFDIAIADPPYNLSKGSQWKWDNTKKLKGFGGDWNKVMQNWDSMTLEDYLSFTLSWLSEIKRIVKPTGSIWIHGTYHNIGVINVALQMLEIEIINEVIWFKRNSFPNLSGRRLTASHEAILWAHTGTSQNRLYMFNYLESKEMECPEDSIKRLGKQMRTVWDIPNNKTRKELAYGKHPTQKPLRLLTRMINLSAKPKELCLVPFAGSGSECIAALRCGLRFLGYEINHEYATIARRRLIGENTLFSESNSKNGSKFNTSEQGG